jgi:hypothetical protein
MPQRCSAIVVVATPWQQESRSNSNVANYNAIIVVALQVTTLPSLRPWFVRCSSDFHWTIHSSPAVLRPAVLRPAILPSYVIHNNALYFSNCTLC